MQKMTKTGLFVLALVGVEVAREWFVLRSLGFEPSRFISWLRGSHNG